MQEIHRLIKEFFLRFVLHGIFIIIFPGKWILLYIINFSRKTRGESRVIIFCQIFQAQVLREILPLRKGDSTSPVLFSLTQHT